MGPTPIVPAGDVQPHIGMSSIMWKYVYRADNQLELTCSCLGINAGPSEVPSQSPSATVVHVALDGTRISLT